MCADSWVLRKLRIKGAVMKRPRHNHTATYKAKAALAALKGDNTLAELPDKFDVHFSQIVQWKAQLLQGAMGVFLTPAEKRESQGPSVKASRKVPPASKLKSDSPAGDSWP
jgi:transposase